MDDEGSAPASTDTRTLARVAFDETHSEAWTIDFDLASTMQPEYPFNSSYSSAAEELRRSGFSISRNIDNALSPEFLSETDILVLIHPTLPKWERTTGRGSPQLLDSELSAVQDWVKQGGSLFILSEYENDKYGNNLNKLIEGFGLSITNSTIRDRFNCDGGVPTWVHPDLELSEHHPLLAGVHDLCFYRAGGIVSADYSIIRPHDSALPHGQALLAAADVGAGRVVVTTDTDLFGDEYFGRYDHLTLWTNIFHWLAMPSAIRRNASTRRHPPTDVAAVLKLVNDLRECQSADGSVISERVAETTLIVEQLQEAIGQAYLTFPHQRQYLEALKHDLDMWGDSGFQTPKFDQSLAAFTPTIWRNDGTELLCVFPQVTPNGSTDLKFDAIHWRVVWPTWLADYNQRPGGPNNQKIVLGELLDYTAGYDSECAVLFPSNVSIAGEMQEHFGTIFCSRESRRYQVWVKSAIECMKMEVPPDLALLLEDQQLAQEAYALWDLIHDSAHFHGYLPLIPFIEGVPQPFWMGAVEELRVDLASLEWAATLDSEGFRLARHVPYAVVLDRIFRFTVAGSRVRDFDGLAGQILFGKLYDANVLQYMDNVLTIHWDGLLLVAKGLRQEIDDIYKDGVRNNYIALWTDLYHFVSQYVTPANNSQWNDRVRDGGSIGVTTEAEAIALQLEDEFPLGHLLNYLKTCVLNNDAVHNRSW